MRLILLLLMFFAGTAQASQVNVADYGAGDCQGASPEHNLAMFNKAVAAAKAEGWKVIYLPACDYTLSDTWVIPSGFVIRGDVARLGTRVIQKTKNSPVIANKAWFENSFPAGSTRIENIWVSGSKSAGKENHCLVLTDYYTTVDEVYATECGGYGVYFASHTKNGSCHKTTLVENTFKNSTIRNSNGGFRNGSKSDFCTPKLTDGTISNVKIDMGGGSGEVLELYEAAGWHVSNLHTYAHRTSLKIDRAGMLNVSGVYVENAGDDGKVFLITKAARSINFNNVLVSDLLDSRHTIFEIYSVSWVERSVINIVNFNGVENPQSKPTLWQANSTKTVVNVFPSVEFSL